MQATWFRRPLDWLRRSLGWLIWQPQPQQLFQLQGTRTNDDGQIEVMLRAFGHRHLMNYSLAEITKSHVIDELPIEQQQLLNALNNQSSSLVFQGFFHDDHHRMMLRFFDPGQQCVVVRRIDECVDDQFAKNLSATDLLKIGEILAQDRMSRFRRFTSCEQHVIN